MSKRRRFVWTLLGSLLLATLVAVQPASGGPIRNPLPEVRGGEPVEDAPPWATLIYTDVVTSAWTCSGSLISSSVVLTAAHCVFDDDGVQAPPAAFGLVVGRGKFGGLAGEERNVTAVQVHPSYDPASLDFDVAILTLDTPVSGAPLPLASAQSDYGLGPVALYGYGLIEPDSPATPGGTPTDVLRKTPDDAYQMVNCPLGKFTAAQLCFETTNANVEVLPGDSGAPWVRKLRGGLVQIGVHSCCGPPLPEAGARVYDALSWIRGHAGLLDPLPGSILRDPATNQAWRVQMDGFRRLVPTAEDLACITSAGSVVVDTPLAQIQQIPDAVGEFDTCSTATSTTTAPSTTIAAVVAAAPTTVRVVPPASVKVSAEAQAPAVDDSLAVTGGDTSGPVGTGLSLLGIGLVLTAAAQVIRLRKAEAARSR